MLGGGGASPKAGSPKGGTNVDLKVEFKGNAKHKKAAQHKFLMTCQQPPVTLKWYPQTATGVIEHCEILLDLRDEPTPESHQHRFEVSAEDDGEFLVPVHMGRPNQPLFIAVNMYSAGESGYDVLGYELEVLTGTWDSGGAPIDNCGRWVNGNGHGFIGIWRDGKPHTGKGVWSALMRGTGEATLAVMQGDWRGGSGSGVLTTGPDAGQVALDPSRDSAKEKRPWEVERDADPDHKDLEVHKFSGDWDEQNMPKTGKGEWMSQTRHVFYGTWKDYQGTGIVKASKRAGKKANDFEDHIDLPTFTGDWLEEKPWDGQGIWYDSNDNAFTGTIKEGKAYTGKGSWQTYETLDDGDLRPLELQEGFWWKGLKLAEAFIEKVERSTVKANRAVEHFFDVTTQQGPLTITLTPVQMTGTFKNLDLLVSTVGVPDMSSFQYRQECSLEKGGVITIEDECFHPARFYVKVIVTGSRGNTSASAMYDFLQYMVDFKTGSWKASKRAIKDEFGRNKWEIPDGNDGCWIAPDGLTFRGLFMHGVPMNGSGTWKSDAENVYEGIWENGKGTGTIMGPNEEEYKGDWLDGWPTHGKGTFSGDDGNTYVPDEGEWRAGAGEGSIVHKTGATFWGSWDGREPIEGRGKWLNKRGQVFEGNWSEGEGMGMISSDDGEIVFEGEWRGETPFKGKGSWRDTDGNVYEGDWRNGILYGKDLSRLNQLNVGNDLSKMTIGGDDDDDARSSATAESAGVPSSSVSKEATKGLAMTGGVKPKAGHRLVTGRRFEGEWRDGKPWTGLGMFRGQMGHVFDGTWKKGRPFEGKGAWMSEEGWVIDGEIRNGRVVVANGKWRDTMPIPYADGTAESFDGRTFEGEWKDGVPFNGKGEWWDGHNHIYSGEWASLEGAGTIEMVDISEVTSSGEYVGKWRGGLPLSGDGLWVDLDGYTFTGTWNNASPYSGQGEWNYADNVYNGRWEEGKGAGRITGTSGSRYKGTWRGWRPWIGQGEFVDPEDHRYTGDYKDGAPWNGTGNWKSLDGHVYRGDLRNGEPWNGEGSFKDMRRNCVYEGKWVESNGQGNIYGEGEEVYHGTWRGGVPWTGKGAWRSIHMKVLSGEWEDSEGAGSIVGLKKGETFEGAWMDGDGAPVTGFGRWFSEETFKNMYEGTWTDTRGTGRITGPDGQIYKGDWWNLSPYKGKGVYRGADGFDFQGAWKLGVRTWRGRKWADTETEAVFKVKRSRFLAGRQTADVRAREATNMASDFTKGETKKSGDESIAAKLLKSSEESQLNKPLALADATKAADATGLKLELKDKEEDDGETTEDQKKKLEALQVAFDCGALSKKDYERAKARITGNAPEIDLDAGADSDDSEAKELEKVRSASMRNRRVANPWAEDIDYCPPSVEPSKAEKKDASPKAKKKKEKKAKVPPPKIDTPEDSPRSNTSSVSSMAHSSDEEETMIEPSTIGPASGGLLSDVTFDESSLVSASRRSRDASPKARSPTSPDATPKLIVRTGSSSPKDATSFLGSPTVRSPQRGSPGRGSPGRISSGGSTGQGSHRWGAPIPRGGKKTVQRRTVEDQARHDEMQWELEAKSWMETNINTAAPNSPEDEAAAAAVAAAEADRPSSVQLRYLRRQGTPQESHLPPVSEPAKTKRRGSRGSDLLPEPEPGLSDDAFAVEGKRSRGNSAPQSQPALDLFEVEGSRKKRTGTPPVSTLPTAVTDLFAVEGRPGRRVPEAFERGLSPSLKAKPRPRDDSKEPLYNSATEFTLVVTCEDEGLIRGAHKLSLRAHSVTAVLTEIKTQLGLAKEPLADNLGLYVMDPEFDEYIVLKSIEDLPRRAKVRLVDRGPPSRSGSAGSRMSEFLEGDEDEYRKEEAAEQEAIQLELLAARTATEKASLRGKKKKKKKKKAPSKTSTSLAELRAVRTRLLESDPGMALGMADRMNAEQRQVLAESESGALHAIESVQDSNTQHIKERNMLRKLQGRKKMAGVRAMVLAEEDARALKDGTADGRSSVEPLPAIDPRAQPRFEGEWEDNKPCQGVGRWLSPDGHLYAGTWNQGRPQDGDGAWSDPRGYVFEGQWKAGVPYHGEGDYSSEKGYVWSGRWKLGVGFGSIMFEHKGEELSRFDGKWTAGDGPPHTGVGNWVDARIGVAPPPPMDAIEGKKVKLPTVEDALDISRQCEGEWRNGELVNGSGQWRSPLTMWQFDGEWKDGEGWGTYKKPGADTRTIPGRWAGGMPTAAQN